MCLFLGPSSNRTLPFNVVAANNFGSGGALGAERMAFVVFHASG